MSLCCSAEIRPSAKAAFVRAENVPSGALNPSTSSFVAETSDQKSLMMLPEQVFHKGRHQRDHAAVQLASCLLKKLIEFD